MSAVKTNGIGKKTKAHLNLTVSLADAWKVSPGELAHIRRKLHGGPAYPVVEKLVGKT